MSNPSAQQTAMIAYEAGARAAAAGDWKNALPLFAESFSLHGANIRYALFLGASLWHTGETDAALELWSLGADHDAMLRIAQYQPQADPLTRQASQLADTELRRFLTDLQSRTIAKCDAPGRIRTALWPQTHFGPVTYVDGGPRPYMFYAPDLPQTAVFDRANTLWTQALETHVDAIREEYLSLVPHVGTLGKPYIDQHQMGGPEWQALRGQNDWTSVHLFKDGDEQPAARECPATLEALSHIPLVHHKEKPMEVFFSVLKARTHIPPHFGLANCRTTVHLPLIIPDNCAIRVGEHEHSWVPSETFIFDDSFDHEAWNKSADTRVVLILEAWRPDMTEGEIAATDASYKARHQWFRQRKLPDVKALIAAT